MEVSRNLSFCYDIGYNYGPLSNLCHVVYATKGFIVGRANNRDPALLPARREDWDFNIRLKEGRIFLPSDALRELIETPKR